MEFLKWFIETQLVKSKAPVWREFFMNAITLILVLVYVYQLCIGIKPSNEFNMLISMVLGFYFNNKKDKNE